MTPSGRPTFIDFFETPEDLDAWLYTIPAYNYAYISNAGQIRIKPMKKAIRIYLCKAFGYLP